MITSGWLRVARASHGLKRFSRDQRGSIGIIVGISLTILLAFGGLGVDAALWMRAKSGAQAAADAGASSAAAAAFAGNPAARNTAEANAAAAANGFHNGMNGVTITVNNPPASGPHAGNAFAYEVIVAAPQTLYLASALPGLTAPTVRARAVAVVNLAAPAPNPTCILGLSPLASNIDVTFNGSTSVTANGCDVDADSPSSSSINTNGGGTVHAANIRTVGGVSGGNIFVSGQIYTHQGTIPDPYAGRTIPSNGASSSANNWSGTIHNPTGVMTINGSVDVKGNTTLDPGIYIINNGGLNSSAGYVVDGTAGVTIILTSPSPSSDNGTFSITGGAHGSGAFNITAPTTGPTAGIALWADGHLPNKEDKFTGGTMNGITGAVYLPSHDVKFAGNSNTAGTCMQLIAYNIIFTGTSNFNRTCTGSGMADPPGTPVPTGWSLVE
jgi:Flp pilus assembly protein TadG